MLNRIVYMLVTHFMFFKMSLFQALTRAWQLLWKFYFYCTWLFMCGLKQGHLSWNGLCLPPVPLWLTCTTICSFPSYFVFRLSFCCHAKSKSLSTSPGVCFHLSWLFMRGLSCCHLSQNGLSTTSNMCNS